MAKSKLTSYSVNIQVPGVAAIQGTWEPSDEERRAAWEMYVELVTRVPVAELRADEGLLREALSSLYTLFATTREILRRYGPDIAQPQGDNQISFGYIAVAVLNAALRPLLARWHPLLLEYEETREDSVSRLDHERRWDRAEELRVALVDARRVLRAYAGQLEQVVGVPSLMIEAVRDESEEGEGKR
ncbi:MAG: hypothetical protein M3Q71_00145 [Chloroflexota bacterium]|nr:hypothetical protein [Chloroflexota bacterium]